MAKIASFMSINLTSYSNLSLTLVFLRGDVIGTRNWSRIRKLYYGLVRKQTWRQR